SKTEEAKNHPTKKSAEPPSATYRWYQVKKNDRYASIAREQLGDAGRWRELHELNKDKFPNPQSIREGVRIKLPAAKVLASAEGRR
ncbi:MAG: LysM domain-containing protein, partial [Planctomycetota bacterium]